MGHKINISQLALLAKKKNGKLISRSLVNLSTVLEWECEHGHRWFATGEAIKIRNSWCHVCAGYTKQGTVGVVSESTLISQWDYGRNTLNPNEVSLGSSKKVWWKCDQGPDHTWEASVGNRSKGRGCPFCANKKLSVTNSVKVVRPDLLSLWDYSKNEIGPEDYIISSSKKVWWKCDRGPDHVWHRSIRQEAVSKGCPYCLSKKVSVTNSLENLKPKAIAFWDSKKNGPFKKLTITASSNKKYFWKCSLADDHAWEAKPTDLAENICPFCSKARASSTYSLFNDYPDISNEWDYDKNSLSPRDVTPMSGKKVWWKCSKGHSYNSVVSNRTLKGHGCPKCSKIHSIPELRLYSELSSIFEDVKFRHRDFGKELDIYIPSLSLGIEYDGSYWHAGKIKTDQEKNRFFEDKLKLIRLREFPLPKLSESDQIIFGVNLTKSDIDNLLKTIVGFGDRSQDDKIKKYIAHENFMAMEHFKELVSFFPDPFPSESFASKHEAVAKQWDYERNFPLTPLNFMPHSRFPAWWVCSLDPKHKWQVSISNRSRGSGCPICSGRTASAENNLSVLYPSIADEFDFEKNGNVLPTQIKPMSGKSFWWKCSRGHSYRLPVYRRTEGRGCTVCVPLSVQKKYPIFEAYEPKTYEDKVRLELIKDEWDNEKNHEVNINKLTVSSELSVWWKCKNNSEHQWQARFITRMRGGGDCYKCRYLVSEQSEGSLAQVHPELLQYWDYTKNKISPQRYLPKSEEVVWWICNNEHSYDMMIKDKTSGNGCPYCSNKRIDSTNSFAASYPNLLRYWDYKKNINIDPNKIAPRTHKKVWWKCSVALDHSWEAAVSNMTRPTAGCPFCAGKRASITNSLIQNASYLKNIYDQEKNSDLNFEDLTLGSNKNVWWKCELGHSYQRVVHSQVKLKGKCKFC